MPIKFNIDLTPYGENQVLLEPTYKTKTLLNRLIFKLELESIPIPTTVVIEDCIILEFMNTKTMRRVSMAIMKDEKIEYSIGNVYDRLQYDQVCHILTTLDETIPSIILEELKQYKLHLE
jgi:hypothetical protein